MAWDWSSCLKRVEIVPGDDSTALTLVNAVWWQLCSPFKEEAGQLLDQWYKQDACYFVEERNRVHLQFHRTHQYPEK